MVVTKRIEKRCKHHMKPDGNGIGKPSKFGIQDHGDNVARTHGKKVDITKPFDKYSRPWFRCYKKARSLGKVEDNFQHCPNNQNLNRQQCRIREKARVPLLERRQEVNIDDYNENLSTYSQYEQ